MRMLPDCHQMVASGCLHRPGQDELVVRVLSLDLEYVAEEMHQA